MNGHGARRSESWIGSFVKYSDNLEAPTIFRQWAAICTLAAVIEQKVWLTTSSRLYPNLYVFLIGHPGTGKTRTIRAAKGYYNELAEPHLAPVSLTFASLVDALVRAKRSMILLPDPPMEYNSLWVAPDELGTLIHKYDKEMADGLSAFYDPDPYGHERRGSELRIKMKSPQVNILSGATPVTLMEVMPEGAWGQGFTSRAIMIFSDERIVGDDFAKTTRGLSEDLLHDLRLINGLVGEFKITADYRDLVNAWRASDEEFAGARKPSHPKLIHYNTRRKVQLYKLSMIAAIDKSNTLWLTKDDFNTAMNWLVSAETDMADIFKAGAPNSDAQAMEEIQHFVMLQDALGKGVSEHKIVNFAREKVPAHSVMRVLEIMDRSNMIKAVSNDPRTGLRLYRANLTSAP